MNTKRKEYTLWDVGVLDAATGEPVHVPMILWRSEHPEKLSRTTPVEMIVGATMAAQGHAY